MHEQQKVWDWYKNFSSNEAPPADRRPNNFFIKDDLSLVPSEFKLTIPPLYRKFLNEIGYGQLREDAVGRVTNSRDNAFLSSKEISMIVNKLSPEWEVYEDLIDENELPFFSTNTNTFYVLAPDGGVYFPFKVRKYAENLDDFLAKLMNDVTFYAEKG